MWSRSRLMAGVLAVAIGLAAPAFAQSTGMVKGKVVDANKQPVEGAKVAIEFTEGVTRKFEVKTNKKGEYIQIGLQPGRYKITATKDGVGTASQEAKISIGATEQVDLTLAAGAAGGSLSKEEEAFRKTFSEGVEANKKGEHDAAIAKFTEALKLRPDCYACQFNIGGSHLSKQEYDKAEAAFKAAGTMNPNSAEPYNALANLYNAQKKYDQAAAMTSEAMKRGGASGASGGTGGASPEVLYNQGVMLMNAQKTAEANAQFAAATKAKPDYADAYYMLGLTSLQLFAMQQQEAKKAEAIAAFEKYLQLDPTGKHANEVKSTIASLKQ